MAKLEDVGSVHGNVPPKRCRYSSRLGWTMRVRRNAAIGRVGASAVGILFLVAAAGCSSSTQKPAAIGTGGGSAENATPTLAASPTTGATSATPSQTASSEPTFTYPADYHLTVDSDATNDPVKNEILADNANFLKAYLADLASGNDKDPVLLKYATPGGAAPWQAAVKSEHSQGLTITGAERFYKRSVGSLNTTKNPASAIVQVCDDQSRSFDKEIATGKVHQTPVTGNSYIWYLFGMRKSSNGTWQVVSFQKHQNDQEDKQECQ